MLNERVFMFCWLGKQIKQLINMQKIEDISDFLFKARQQRYGAVAMHIGKKSACPVKPADAQCESK